MLYYSGLVSLYLVNAVMPHFLAPGYLLILGILFLGVIYDFVFMNDNACLACLSDDTG